MTELIRILIADDHPVVRDGLFAILTTQPDFTIVGQAASGDEAVRLAERSRPDMILLDLEMPGMDGVTALQQIKSAHPAIEAIVFTAFDTDERILSAIKSGARGYLLKGAPREELFTAIRVVSRGESLLQPVVASRLLHHIAGGADAPSLTPRELEVLSLLAQGKTNKEIAGQLVVTERTVKYHVSSILSKLGAGNRTEAVAFAARLGIIER